MSVSVEKRILGAFYGQALGDAMGMPSELWSRRHIKDYFGKIDRFLPGPPENEAACFFKAAEVTDDTSMAIAVAEAIIEDNGTINPDTIAHNILKWAERFGAFDKNILGPTSKMALNAIKSGDRIESLNNLGITNGAAMRAMPLGCLLPSGHIDNFIASVELASSPTHKSDISVAGAVVIAWAISGAIENHGWDDIKKGLPEIADRAQYKAINTCSPNLACRIEHALQIAGMPCDTEQVLDNIYNITGAGISAIESVPAAVAMVELANGEPDQCAIFCANLGGDTDTIGAMATAICGALTGIDGINGSYIDQLDAVNQFDFITYSKAFTYFRAQSVRE